MNHYTAKSILTNWSLEETYWGAQIIDAEKRGYFHARHFDEVDSMLQKEKDAKVLELMQELKKAVSNVDFLLAAMAWLCIRIQLSDLAVKTAKKELKLAKSLRPQPRQSEA